MIFEEWSKNPRTTLSQMRFYENELDSLIKEKPSLWAIEKAEGFLNEIFKIGLEIESITSTEKGGIVFCFCKKNLHAEIEINNDQTITALIKNIKNEDATKFWEIDSQNEKELEKTFNKINYFLNPHLSYSQLVLWARCSFQHYLARIKEVTSFSGNEYTSFGTALHSCCENIVKEEYESRKKKLLWKLDFGKEYENFLQTFRQELSSLDSFDQKMVKTMEEQAKPILPLIIPNLKKAFGNYKVFDIEHLIYDDIEGSEDIKFKGYIDLVLIAEDGHIPIIDYKTCSWGWDAKKKNDKYTIYQLTLYKNFLSKKLNVERNKFKTYYALLKRTAKTENVEIFEVTSGEVRTKNALTLLRQAAVAVANGVKFKNKKNCTNPEFGWKCQFYETEHCPK